MPTVEELTARLKLDASDFEAGLKRAGAATREVYHETISLGKQIVVSAAALAIVKGALAVATGAMTGFSGSANVAAKAGGVALTQGLKAAGSAATGATGMLGRLAPILLGAGGVVGAFLLAKGAIDGVKASIEAIGNVLPVGTAKLIEMQAASRRLEAEFSQVAGAAANMRAAIEAVNATTPFFEREDIANAAATLAHFGASQAQIQEFLPTLTDMAAVMGTDVVDASTRLGMALIGSTRGLRDFGIYVKEGATLTEILAAVQAKAAIFQEQAALKTEDLEGKQRDLLKTNRETAEHIANVFVPAMKLMTDWSLFWARANLDLARTLDTVFRPRSMSLPKMPEIAPPLPVGASRGGTAIFGAPRVVPGQGSLDAALLAGVAGFEQAMGPKPAAAPPKILKTEKDVLSLTQHRLAMNDLVKEGSAAIKGQIDIITGTLAITKSILKPETRTDLDRKVALLRVAYGQALAAEDRAQAEFVTRANAWADKIRTIFGGGAGDGTDAVMQQRAHQQWLDQGGPQQEQWEARRAENERIWETRQATVRLEDEQLQRQIATALEVSSIRQEGEAAAAAILEDAARKANDPDLRLDLERRAGTARLRGAVEAETRAGEIQLQFSRQAADLIGSELRAIVKGEGGSVGGLADRGTQFGLTSAGVDAGPAALFAAVVGEIARQFSRRRDPREAKDADERGARLWRDFQAGIPLEDLGRDRSRDISGTMVTAADKQVEAARQQVDAANKAHAAAMMSLIGQEESVKDRLALARILLGEKSGALAPSEAGKKRIDVEIAKGIKDVEATIKPSGRRIASIADAPLSFPGLPQDGGPIPLRPGSTGGVKLPGQGIIEAAIGRELGPGAPPPTPPPPQPAVGTPFWRAMQKAKGIGPEIALDIEAPAKANAQEAAGKGAGIINLWEDLRAILYQIIDLEDAAGKRGTQQDPLVIMPRRSDSIAFLDRNALMRQRTAGAGRALNVTGNVGRISSSTPVRDIPRPLFA